MQMLPWGVYRGVSPISFNASQHLWKVFAFCEQKWERKKTDHIVLKPRILPELEQKHKFFCFLPAVSVTMYRSICICSNSPFLTRGESQTLLKNGGNSEGLFPLFFFFNLYRNTNAYEDFPERTRVPSQHEGARRRRARGRQAPSAAPHRRSPTPSTGQSGLSPAQKQTLTLLTRTATTWKLASGFSVRFEKRRGGKKKDIKTVNSIRRTQRIRLIALQCKFATEVTQNLRNFLTNSR